MFEVVVVVLFLAAAGALQLHSQLVQRVVITLADLDGPPGITSVYHSLDAYLLGMLAKGLLLRLVFQLQQQALLLQLLDG